MSNNYYVLRERNKWVVYKRARWWLFDLDNYLDISSPQKPDDRSLKYKIPHE